MLTAKTLAPPSDAVLRRLMALHPRAIDLSLGRIERLLAALGHPERRLAPVFHIAGTNGKGSTMAFMRAMLEAAGYRVQTYTSPHLVAFNERIRLADGYIEEDDLTAFLEECEAANGGDPITYFEITTAAAFLAFSRTPADILLMETGLGGRLDATNVVPAPVLDAISTVSVDHTQFLGESLAQIAAEKAGILKPGLAAVIGPQADRAMQVIEARARALGAPLYRFGEEWSVAATAGGMTYRGARGRMDLPAPGLAGPHQIVNAGLAIAAIERLDGFEVGDGAIHEGLRRVDWPGRLQRLRRGPLVSTLPAGWELWLDGGHNIAAGEALAAATAGWRDMPLYLVFGMLRAKNPEPFLAALAPWTAAVRAVPVPGDHDALDPAEAAALARRSGHHRAEPAATLASALADLAAGGPARARVLICGSLYLAGAVLAGNG